MIMPRLWNKLTGSTLFVEKLSEGDSEQMQRRQRCKPEIWIGMKRAEDIGRTNWTLISAALDTWPLAMKELISKSTCMKIAGATFGKLRHSNSWTPNLSLKGRLWKVIVYFCQRTTGVRDWAPSCFLHIFHKINVFVVTESIKFNWNLNSRFDFVPFNFPHYLFYTVNACKSNMK